MFEEEGFAEVAGVLQLRGKGKERNMAGCISSVLVESLNEGYMELRRTVCQDDVHDRSKSLDQRYVGSHCNNVTHIWFLDTYRDHGYSNADDD